MHEPHRLGRRGEDLAAAELSRRGFRVLARNVRLPSAEIDIVAEDAAGLVFIEVKTRREARLTQPYEAVDRRRRSRLLRGAVEYLDAAGLENVDYRFGVVSIVAPELGRPAQVEWLDEAWSDDDASD